MPVGVSEDVVCKGFKLNLFGFFHALAFRSAAILVIPHFAQHVVIRHPFQAPRRPSSDATLGSYKHHRPFAPILAFPAPHRVAKTYPLAMAQFQAARFTQFMLESSLAICVQHHHSIPTPSHSWSPTPARR